MKTFLVVLTLSSIFLFGCTTPQIKTETESPHIWKFSVSGDSRNCGDVVMPSIAKETTDDKAQFYIHLGDFRALFKIDEDIAHDPKYKEITSLDEYRKVAWDDFIENQLTPFGHMPVYLGIGNHETIDRTRPEYIYKFKKWLDQDPIVATRSAQKKSKTNIYYHWIQSGVDFIILDNGTDDQFDSDQMKWLQEVLAQDNQNSGILSIVVGMHKALPDSISYGHSMSESKNPISVQTGREVYKSLLNAQNQFHKNVYIIGSHSHFLMDGTFNTEYWNKNGGLLPGWIVGTAGAQRYPLPEDSTRANTAKTKTYGYLLGIVDPDRGNQIHFEYREIQKGDVLPNVISRYGKDLVDFCFEQNYLDKKTK